MLLVYRLFFRLSFFLTLPYAQHLIINTIEFIIICCSFSFLSQEGDKEDELSKMRKAKPFGLPPSSRRDGILSLLFCFEKEKRKSKSGSASDRMRKHREGARPLYVFMPYGIVWPRKGNTPGEMP